MGKSKQTDTRLSVPYAPAGWRDPFARDHQWQQARKIAGDSLKGSAVERAERRAAAFDFACQTRGRSSNHDKIAWNSEQLGMLEAKLSMDNKRHLPTAETEAAIAARKKDLERLRHEDDLVRKHGGWTDPADEVRELRSEHGGLEQQIAEADRRRQDVPEEVEEWYGELTTQLEEAEAREAADREEYREIARQKGRGIGDARRKMAAHLRTITMPEQAAKVTDTIGRRVGYHERHPEAPFPARVRRLLYGVEKLGELADQLDNGPDQQDTPFREALGERLVAVLYSQEVRRGTEPGGMSEAELMGAQF